MRTRQAQHRPAHPPWQAAAGRASLRCPPPNVPDQVQRAHRRAAALRSPPPSRTRARTRTLRVRRPWQVPFSARAAAHVRVASATHTPPRPPPVARSPPFSLRTTWQRGPLTQLQQRYVPPTAPSARGASGPAAPAVGRAHPLFLNPPRDPPAGPHTPSYKWPVLFDPRRVSCPLGTHLGPLLCPGRELCKAGSKIGRLRKGGLALSGRARGSGREAARAPPPATHLGEGRRLEDPLANDEVNGVLAVRAACGGVWVWRGAGGPGSSAALCAPGSGRAGRRGARRGAQPLRGLEIAAAVAPRRCWTS